MARSLTRVPYHVYGLLNPANDAASRLSSELYGVVARFLRGKKYISASLSHVPSLRLGGQEMARALSRVGKIVERECFKAAPYLKHLSLYSPDHGFISYERNPPLLKMSGTVVVTEGSRLNDTLLRYVRLLNYLSVKNGLPFFLRLYQFTGLSVEDLDSDATAPRVRRVSLTLRLSPIAPEYLTTGDVLSSEAFRLLQDGLTASGSDPDGVYRWTDNPCGIRWAAHSSDSFVESFSTDALQNLPVGMATPELIFFHIPSIVQSVVTLSRKLSYAYSAFAVGAAEN